MKVLARWLRGQWSKIVRSDSPTLPPLSQHYSHERSNDSLDFAHPGVARGTGQDTFLAGYPGESTPMIPRTRFLHVVGHRWHVPDRSLLTIDDPGDSAGTIRLPRCPPASPA